MRERITERGIKQKSIDLNRQNEMHRETDEGEERYERVRETSTEKEGKNRRV